MSGLITPLMLFWLCALIIFGVVEAITVGLVSVWFAAGALVALIAEAAGANIWLEMILFIVVSIAMLLLLRPLSKKTISESAVPTNADRNIGREAVVTEDIDHLRGSGAVKLDGMEWTARSLNGDRIEQGNVVIVRQIQGVKLIVELLKETSVD